MGVPDAESAWAPYLRFGRNVLIVDAIATVIVMAYCLKSGRTSVEDSAFALFIAGAVLLALAVLPSIAKSSYISGYGSFYVNRNLERFYELPSQVEAGEEQLHMSAILLAAGILPILYSLAVALLFL